MFQKGINMVSLLKRIFSHVHAEQSIRCKRQYNIIAGYHACGLADLASSPQRGPANG